jgi:hypothetical protein
MLALQVVVNTYSPITGMICLTCLIFLFFESAFGICLGCLFYNLVFKERAQHCPGEVCTPHQRHTSQFTHLSHWAVVGGFLLFILLVGILFHDQLRQSPVALFGLAGHGGQ